MLAYIHSPSTPLEIFTRITVLQVHQQPMVFRAHHEPYNNGFTKGSPSNLYKSSTKLSIQHSQVLLTPLTQKGITRQCM